MQPHSGLPSRVAVAPRRGAVFMETRPLQERSPGGVRLSLVIYPEGVASLSPGLLYSATLGNGRRSPNPNGVMAQSHISRSSQFYVVLARGRPKLILPEGKVATLSGLERNRP